jgi:Ni/Fe-hydrogenase 1 B-type cytochrome subunit
MTLSVGALLMTGGLFEHAPMLYAELRDMHFSAGYVLGLSLSLRIYLLFFGQGSAHWRALVPVRRQLGVVGAMLQFYLTLGRAPLPEWHAHNPLWAPLYLALVGVLIVQVVTGLAHDAPYLIIGTPIAPLHHGLTTAIGVFVFAHILGVFSHDLKGTGSDVSAIINGHRIFIIQGPRVMAAQFTPTVSTVDRDRGGSEYAE